MAALIVSQRAPACVQQLSLSTAPLSTAMAPGLGLLLDETIFESYNTRYDKEKEAHEGTAHVRLSLDAISDAVQQFKRARIYPHIAQTELQDRPFRTFLEREDEQPTDWAGLISASEKHTHAAAVSDKGWHTAVLFCVDFTKWLCAPTESEDVLSERRSRHRMHNEKRHGLQGDSTWLSLERRKLHEESYSTTRGPMCKGAMHTMGTEVPVFD